MLQKYLLSIFLAAAVMLTAGGAMAIPTVDGNFGLIEWAGYYTDDDGVGPGRFVGPGYGGQAFDVEYTGLYFDSNTLYFGLQTGFDLINGADGYTPGDFALDVNSDGTYEYAIDYSISETDVTYSLYDVSAWSNTAIPAWETIFEVSSGSLVHSWTQNDAFGSGVFSSNADGGTSYVLEGSLQMSYLASYLGPEITMQWTMGCGNDIGKITADPVPEPATMLLLGFGLFGLAAVGRKEFLK